MPLAMEAPSFNQWIIFRLYDSLPEKKKTSKIESKMKQMRLHQTKASVQQRKASTK